jgi:hypothetical protein
MRSGPVVILLLLAAAGAAAQSTVAPNAAPSTVPSGALRVVLSVDAELVAFRDTIADIVVFELGQQNAAGTLAVDLELVAAQPPVAATQDDIEETEHEAATVAAAFAARVPHLLLVEVQGTSAELRLRLIWYDVEAAARAEASRNGRIGLDLDALVVAALRELLAVSPDARLVAEDLLRRRRQQAFAIVAQLGMGILTVAGSLGGDISPSTLPVGYVGAQFDRRGARFGAGVEVSYFPLFTGNPGSPGGDYLLPISIEVRYGIGDPLEFYARGGPAVALLSFFDGGQNNVILPGISVGIGADLVLVGTASVYADFGFTVAYAGPGELFIGIRPSVGLMFVLQ